MINSDKLSAIQKRVRAATGLTPSLDDDLVSLSGDPESGNWSGGLWPTNSIDDALELVERLLPGWTYIVDEKHKLANLSSPDWPDGPSSDGGGATLPLAILDAMLSALIVQESPQDMEDALAAARRELDAWRANADAWRLPAPDDRVVIRLADRARLALCPTAVPWKEADAAARREWTAVIKAILSDPMFDAVCGRP